MSESIGKRIPGMFGSLMVLMSAALAVIAVSEIAARDSFAAFLRQQGDTLRGEYFESTRNRLANTTAGTPEREAEDKDKNLSDEIDAIRLFEQQVRILGSLGAMNPDQTLEGVRRRFEAYRVNRDNRAALARANTVLSNSESQLAALKRRIASLDEQIGVQSDTAKAVRDAAATRRAEYGKLFNERDEINAELAAMDAKYGEILRVASPPPEPTKEYAQAREKWRLLIARGESIASRLKSLGDQSAARAVDASGDGALDKLKIQRAEASDKIGPLESNIATAKAQLALYQPDTTKPAENWYSPLPKLHSDYLLALSIMACSALGALIVGLRGTAAATSKDVTLGIASGFVCYFAIKGGKYVFILSAQTDLVTFNPYGSAFAGLLVGLFSERVYSLLTVLVGDLEKRIRLAITTGAANQAGPETLKDQPAPEATKGQPATPALVENPPDIVPAVRAA